MLGEKLKPNQPPSASMGENPKSSGEPAVRTYPPDYYQSRSENSREMSSGKVRNTIMRGIGGAIVGVGVYQHDRVRQFGEDIVNFVQKQI